MREILFRGKRINDGDWVYGCYVKMCDCEGNVTHHISPPWCKVDPETICQYTGLTDKNGKKVFEGDVVTAYFRINRSRQTFEVCFDDGMFLFDNRCVRVPMYDIFCIKAIGNIHDNPELMEEA